MTGVVDARRTSPGYRRDIDRCGLGALGPDLSGGGIERGQHQLAVHVVELGAQFDAIGVADDEDP